MSGEGRQPQRPAPPEHRPAIERLKTPAGERASRARSERLLEFEQRFGPLRADKSRGPRW